MCKNAACGDGFVRAGVEQCDDGNNVNTDGCVGGCKTAACGDGFVQAGVEECDDGNAANNDGCSSLCKSETCMTFTNTGNEDVTNNNWFDACVAAPGNTVTVRLYDVNNNIVYQASGPKVGVWSQNQITSTVASTEQYYSVNHDRQISLNNGDKLLIAGKSANNLGCGGSFGNGYGIMIYPNAPNYIANIKLFVAPYRHFNNYPNQNNAGTPRLFSGWTQGTEIMWNNGTPMGSCSSVTGFIGKFTVTVTP
jgi:cysteine-rich repeat protein